MVLTPFHLAIPVADLLAAEQFYRETLGCSIGRRSDQWIDFNLFGHQLVCHQVASSAAVGAVDANPVDGHDVPVPHFGVVLDIPMWMRLRDRLLGLDVEFVIEPHIRFAGEVGEQATMFLLDPCGNALEFKAFADIEGELFKA
jgi:extradiol dioxygenase family protein